MTAFRVLSAALTASLTALSAAAQSRPADIASAPTTATAPMRKECAKPIARHDHAAEKGMPKSQATAEPCPPVTAASAPKSKLTHDHAKFHKNQ